MERILWQTAESHTLCNGKVHVLVTNDGADWPQGPCDCEEDSQEPRAEYHP